MYWTQALQVLPVKRGVRQNGEYELSRLTVDDLYKIHEVARFDVTTWRGAMHKDTLRRAVVEIQSAEASLESVDLGVVCRTLTESCSVYKASPQSYCM